jgi:dTDP-4-amino-4,6-dideoxygalactose transaminase
MLNFDAQYTAIKHEILSAIEEVLDSGRYVNGPAVSELEAAVADYSGAAAGVGVSSGTDALLVSLMALGVGAGDEVVTTPFTFFATAGCIWRVGAKPVFVDIDPETFNIDPAKIAPAVTERTRAILPVHLYGQMAEMDEIMAVAAEGDLAVVEDAAQAIGAIYKGRRAGAIGTTGCFSFYPTKNLPGFGDGGMVVCQDEELAERIRVLRDHGQKPTYYYRHIGGNFRLDTLQAAGLLVRLARLEQWSDMRRANAARYDELLAEVEQVRTPVIREYNQSIYNQYVIRAARRDELRAHLIDHGVAAAIYYPLGLHEQDCFAELGYRKGDFPETERAAEEVLALPIFPGLTDPQIQTVVETIKNFYAGG